jgi:hypothetical protein
MKFMEMKPQPNCRGDALCPLPTNTMAIYFHKYATESEKETEFLPLKTRFRVRHKIRRCNDERTLKRFRLYLTQIS